MNKDKTITGGCLCGAVRYEINGLLLDADHCHCSMCRRQHGAAFASYAEINPSELTWVLGKEHLKTYQVPTGGGWCFCTECGSTLAGTKQGKINMIALGTVEGDPGVRPQFHIFVDSKAKWYDIADDLPQFAQRPPDE